MSGRESFQSELLGLTGETVPVASPPQRKLNFLLALSVVVLLVVLALGGVMITNLIDTRGLSSQVQILCEWLKMTQVGFRVKGTEWDTHFLLFLFLRYLCKTRLILTSRTSPNYNIISSSDILEWRPGGSRKCEAFRYHSSTSLSSVLLLWGIILYLFLYPFFMNF